MVCRCKIIVLDISHAPKWFERESTTSMKVYLAKVNFILQPYICSGTRNVSAATVLPSVGQAFSPPLKSKVRRLRWRSMHGHRITSLVERHGWDLAFPVALRFFEFFVDKDLTKSYSDFGYVWFHSLQPGLCDKDCKIASTSDVALLSSTKSLQGEIAESCWYVSGILQKEELQQKVRILLPGVYLIQSSNYTLVFLVYLIVTVLESQSPIILIEFTALDF
jgi:hypothetical protein